MDIKSTFINLTKKTYPHGTEDELVRFLPNDILKDEFGNYYKQIGESPSTMFCAHLDTASSQVKEINHVMDGDIIKTDGSSILGADDKAGVTILLYMIYNNIPGLYYFFVGEEVGCVGSSKLAAKHNTEPIEYIKKVVSFDRRGKNSVITHQMSTRCCSEDFGNDLASKLNEASKSILNDGKSFNYSNDPTGVYTDSAKFTKIYPECTNISVGYQSEHTHYETQDITHLENLAKSVLLIDWESLPIVRDPSSVEYRQYDWSKYYSYSKPSKNYSYHDDWDEYDIYDNEPKYNKKTEKIYFLDDEFGKYLSYVEIDGITFNIVGVCLSDDRVEFEENLIRSFLEKIDVDFYDIIWDGFNLIIENMEKESKTLTRNDIKDYISELDLSKYLIEE